MTKENYVIPSNWFIDSVIEKFRAYAIVDLENKKYTSLSVEKGEYVYKLIDDLQEKIIYYSNASKQQLLDELIVSSFERYNEEEMIYYKQVFDMVLAKQTFSSYH